MSNKITELLKRRKDLFIFTFINSFVWSMVNGYFNPEDSWVKIIFLLMLPMLITGFVYEYLWRRRQKRKQGEKPL
jgi:hypothetical protein